VAKKKQPSTKLTLEEDLSFQFHRLHANLLSILSEQMMFTKRYVKNAKVTKKGNKFVFQHDFSLADYRNTRTRAYMTYCFSIFEIFASQLLRYLIKKDPNIKDRYAKKWKKFLDEKINKQQHTHIILDVENASKPSWQVENYNILLQLEKSNIANFLSSLLGIKAGKKGSKQSINSAEFNLFWKVRHLLTHRGEKIDEQLIKEIRNNRQIKEENSVFNKFLKAHAEKNKINTSKEVNINPKEIYGKTVIVPLPQVVHAIIFQISWLVMHIKLVKIEPFFTNLYHDILKNMCNHKFVDKTSLMLGMEIYTHKFEHVHNKNVNEIDDSEKFNFHLLNYELYKLAVSPSKNITKEDKQKFKKRYEILRENHFKFSDKFDKNIIKLLDAHLRDKRAKFLEILKKTNMKLFKDWEDWFIFDRYKKNKEFKEIVKQKK
tara:strand:- start:90 stop:1385 length:1296 start_codon:yes stop_codon:yes gene_type:complete